MEGLYKLGVTLVRTGGGVEEAAEVFEEGAHGGDVRCMVNYAALCMRANRGGVEVGAGAGETRRRVAEKWLKTAVGFLKSQLAT